MIKLKFSLENTISNEYWKAMNPTNKYGEFESSSLIKKLESSIDDRNNDLSIRRFLYEFKLDNYKLLKLVTICPIEDFEKVTQYVNRLAEYHLHGKLYIETPSKNGTKYQKSDYGEIVYKVFGYDSKANYITKSKKMIYDRLDIQACPYCNELPVREFKMESGTVLRDFDLDHFYPKAVYPYMSMSLYNLVPSCIPCNRVLKKDKPFTTSTHLNPHFDSIHDSCKFEIMYPLGDITVKSKLEEIYRLHKTQSLTAQSLMKTKYKDIKIDFNYRDGYDGDDRCDTFKKDLNFLSRYNRFSARLIAHYQFISKRLDKSKVMIYDDLRDSLSKSLTIDPNKLECFDCDLYLDENIISIEEKTKVFIDIQNQCIDTFRI